MKKRLEKKVEKMRRKKIHEILELVLEINTTEDRVREHTGSKPTAFFEFYGNAGLIDERVIPNGWSTTHEHTKDTTMFKASGITFELQSLADMLDQLKKQKKELQNAGKM